MEGQSLVEEGAAAVVEEDASRGRPAGQFVGVRQVPQQDGGHQQGSCHRRAQRQGQPPELGHLASLGCHLLPSQQPHTLQNGAQLLAFGLGQRAHGQPRRAGLQTHHIQRLFDHHGKEPRRRPAEAGQFALRLERAFLSPARYRL